MRQRSNKDRKKAVNTATAPSLPVPASIGVRFAERSAAVGECDVIAAGNTVARAFAQVRIAQQRFAQVRFAAVLCRGTLRDGFGRFRGGIRIRGGVGTARGDRPFRFVALARRILVVSPHSQLLLLFGEILLLLILLQTFVDRQAGHPRPPQRPQPPYHHLVAAVQTWTDPTTIEHVRSLAPDGSGVGLRNRRGAGGARLVPVDRRRLVVRAGRRCARRFRLRHDCVTEHGAAGIPLNHWRYDERTLAL